MKNGIYKFHCPIWGREDITGTFLATRNEIEGAYNQVAQFADIKIVLTEEMFSLVTEDEVAVELFQQYGFECGTCPLAYI